MSSAIQIRELKKSYGSHIVLKGLNFQIEQGEIFALNGAEKEAASGPGAYLQSGYYFS